MIFHYRCPRCHSTFKERTTGYMHVPTFCKCEGGTKMTPDGITYDHAIHGPHARKLHKDSSGEREPSRDGKTGGAASPPGLPAI